MTQEDKIETKVGIEWRIIRFEKSWKDKLKETWRTRKTLNMDGYSLFQREGARHTIGYALDDEGEYVIDTTRSINQLVKDIENYLKEHDEVKVSIMAEFINDNGDLEEDNSGNSLKIVKL